MEKSRAARSQPRRIRAIRRRDANAVAAMMNEAAAYFRALGDPNPGGELTAERVRRDGFGPDAAFAGLVAEDAGEPVGYLLYHFGYDADDAVRILHVADLFVREGARRRGAARRLMERAAAIARAAGADRLLWTVYKPNRLAYAFYESLGARYVRDLDLMYLPVTR
jgi:GNAT superfamily N-acetyltransferase